jgi:hypothetical protein
MGLESDSATFGCAKSVPTTNREAFQRFGFYLGLLFLGYTTPGYDRLFSQLLRALGWPYTLLEGIARQAGERVYATIIESHLDLEDPARYVGPGPDRIRAYVRSDRNRSRRLVAAACRFDQHPIQPGRRATVDRRVAGFVETPETRSATTL